MQEHHTQTNDKLATREEAAHEKRNWVRLTFACNDHCVFCLDSNTHDGTMRDREEVKAQILDGRRKGATRLILSGGEPTIHPNFIDFVRLGASAGYRRIQTVTNGRMFSYGEFLGRALDAGLGEITFSIHGPNAKVHDALVGTKGAWDEEVKALRAALADGRAVVNIDIVVNRANVRHLPEMMRLFYGMGVREFDLLQVIPFGRAFTDGRETLFYDIAEMRPYLLEALEYSKRPDVHLWINRFPPQHLEGFEHLIQDPYKLNDEVRGRKEEFAHLLDDGVPLDCRDPARCKHCYLERLCDTLEGVIATSDANDFSVLRVDTEWEAAQPPVFGGDPASAKRSRDEKRRLPIAESADRATKRAAMSLEDRVASSRASTLAVSAPDVERARGVLGRFPKLTRLELDLASYAGLATLDLGGKRITRARARDVAQAKELLAIDLDFEVIVDLTRETAAWLVTLEAAPPRLALRQPTYDTMSEAKERDVDLAELFARFTHPVPVEGVPACILGRAPRARAKTLDSAMMTPDGRLEIFRYARRYILEGYTSYSTRCDGCAERARCDGVHINWVRAHGYAPLAPLASAAVEQA